MVIWFLIFLQSFAMDVGDVVDPRPDSPISDMADVLDAQRQAKMAEMLGSIKESVGVEVVVVTVPSTSISPKAFAVALGNAWEVGDADLDNGLVILLALQERRIEMEQGVGLEDVLPAAWLQQMQQTHMVPRFKSGDFGGGLEAGVVQLQARFKDGVGESTATPQPRMRIACIGPKCVEERAASEQTQPVNHVEPEVDPSGEPLSWLWELSTFDALLLGFGFIGLPLYVVFQLAGGSKNRGGYGISDSTTLQDAFFGSDDDEYDSGYFDDDDSGGGFGGGGAGSSW